MADWVSARDARCGPDFGKAITDDYECKRDCRNCPFPGAKCYKSKYDRYNTGLLIHVQRGIGE